MIKLIKNEFIKIFNKKSIYILLLIMFAFVVLTNCIYKFALDDNGNIKSINSVDSILEYSKEELKNLDTKDPTNESMHVSLQTDIDIYELLKKYGEESWQSQIINTELSEIIYNINENKISSNKDEDTLKLYEEEYKKYIDKFEADDWKYFVKEDLKEVDKSIKDLEKQKNETKDKLKIKELDENIELFKFEKEIMQYRLDKNISYETSYLNNALNNYRNYGNSIIGKDVSKIEKYDEKFEFYKSKAAMEVNKYIFTNEVNLDKINDTRGILINLFTEYELFLIVIIVMISGVIVAEEFNKGTIKQLLLKPYTRGKILLSKYITSILMILFTLVSLVIMQLLVGSILFGFESLKIPEVVYSFNANSIKVYNIFHYVLITILNKLPLLILITTFTFFIGVLTTNSAVAITLGLVGYMSSSLINNIATYMNVKLLKYFITPNWDFTIYAFGMIPENKHINFSHSLIMSIAYLVILMIPMFIIFKKRNIKNI